MHAIIIGLLLLSSACFAQYGRYFNTMRMKGDTLQLEASYSYNDPDERDEEHGSTTIFKFFNSKNLKENIVYTFPSKTILGYEEHWSGWRPPSPKSLQGTIEIISLSKDEIKAKIIIDEASGKKREGQFVFKNIESQ